jgi:hypothetical protein
MISESPTRTYSADAFLLATYRRNSSVSILLSETCYSFVNENAQRRDANYNGVDKDSVKTVRQSYDCKQDGQHGGKEDGVGNPDGDKRTTYANHIFKYNFIHNKPFAFFLSDQARLREFPYVIERQRGSTEVKAPLYVMDTLRAGALPIDKAVDSKGSAV